jgi:hypothetical protein
MRGVVDAGWIVGGKAGSRIISQQFARFGLALPGGTLTTDLISAVAVGFLADMVLPARVRPLVVAGALTAPIETFIAGAGIPGISPALSGMGAYPRMRVVRNGRSALGSYARPALGSYARKSLGMIPTPALSPRASASLGGDFFDEAYAY